MTASKAAYTISKVGAMVKYFIIYFCTFLILLSAYSPFESEGDSVNYPEHSSLQSQTSYTNPLQSSHHENGKFHQCHLGHCSYTYELAGWMPIYVLIDIFVAKKLSIPFFEYQANLFRPPIV